MKSLILAAALLSATSALANDASIPTISVAKIEATKSEQGAVITITGGDVANLLATIPPMRSVMGPAYDRHFRELQIQSGDKQISIRCSDRETNEKGKLVPLPAGPTCEITMGAPDFESDTLKFIPNKACHKYQ